MKNSKGRTMEKVKNAPILKRTNSEKKLSKYSDNDLKKFHAKGQLADNALEKAGIAMFDVEMFTRKFDKATGSNTHKKAKQLDEAFHVGSNGHSLAYLKVWEEFRDRKFVKDVDIWEVDALLDNDVGLKEAQRNLDTIIKSTTSLPNDEILKLLDKKAASAFRKVQRLAKELKNDLTEAALKAVKNSKGKTMKNNNKGKVMKVENAPKIAQQYKDSDKALQIVGKMEQLLKNLEQYSRKVPSVDVKTELRRIEGYLDDVDMEFVDFISDVDSGQAFDGDDYMGNSKRENKKRKVMKLENAPKVAQQAKDADKALTIISKVTRDLRQVDQLSRRVPSCDVKRELQQIEGYIEDVESEFVSFVADVDDGSVFDGDEYMGNSKKENKKTNVIEFTKTAY